MIIISVSIVLFLFYLYSLYSQIIRNKNMVLESLSGVDVQLKRRYDLIPNLVETAKAYMNHEKYIYEKLAELRTSAMNSKLGSQEKFNTEMELSESVQKLLVTVENYPELKANETMLKLMAECTDTEDNIAAARRFYNTALTQLKNSIEIFPGCFFATFAGEVRFYNYFQAKDEERKNIKI